MVEKYGISEYTTRLQNTTNVIQSIASGDFAARAEVTSKMDIIDALAVGINMLAEELEFGTVGLEYVNNRINEILEVVQKCARREYEYCEVSQRKDSFDALCMGLNMMIDDVKSSIEKDKERVEELEKAYQELQETQHATLNIMEDLDGQRKELTALNKKLQREIIERKRTEEKLNVTMGELERSNKELEHFAYIASHDLQEPLRMVISYLQLLDRRYEDKLDKDAKDFIGYAVDGASRMQQLINDLLTYSRVGTKGKPLEPIDSETVFQRAIENLNVAIEESGAVITHDKLPTITADDLQLLQLLQNLIGNAIKFRSEEPPQVNILTEKRENEWLFSISDNGIGMDPKHQERIFQIFQRLHGRNEYPGTGIGLAVCKKIVERHGGRIWVESEPGKGSTFYFTIPNIEGERP